MVANFLTALILDISGKAVSRSSGVEEVSISYGNKGNEVSIIIFKNLSLNREYYFPLVVSNHVMIEGNIFSLL